MTCELARTQSTLALFTQTAFLIHALLGGVCVQTHRTLRHDILRLGAPIAAAAFELVPFSYPQFNFFAHPLGQYCSGARQAR